MGRHWRELITSVCWVTNKKTNAISTKKKGPGKQKKAKGENKDIREQKTGMKEKAEVVNI